MKHGIVSFGGKACFELGPNSVSPLLASVKDSETLRIWKEAIQELGLDPDDHGLKPEHLFALIKDAFEKKLKCKLDVVIDRKYIASIDGETPIPHDDSSRIFASNGIVYLDELMISILFEYVATYYIWARFEDEVFHFCFPYALNSLNYCCRQGFLNSDKNKAKLSSILKKYCDAVAINVIADLYWSILSFAFCHELAHICLGHTDMSKQKNSEELWQDELSADALGYDIFLSIIDGKIKALDSPFLTCFHDYLYAAPMILFLFYEDLYYMEYWLFGESVESDCHPPLDMRIQRLLEISEDEQYQFDTVEGNIVLNNYWDTSEKFRLELFYKLKNGKLEHVAQKGKIPMDNAGYKEALAFDTSLRSQMREMANEYGVDPAQMVGLYDIATRVEMHDEGTLMHFVWSKGDSVYSSKPYNMIFRLRASLIAIIDNALSLSIPSNETETIMFMLRILLKVGMFSTVKINEAQVKVLAECHRSNAYYKPIDEEIILKRTGVPPETIDDLCRLRCIELQDGRIWLKEEIWL